MAGAPGIEPGYSESKSDVLPLDDAPTASLCECKGFPLPQEILNRSRCKMPPTLSDIKVQVAEKHSRDVVGFFPRSATSTRVRSLPRKKAASCGSFLSNLRSLFEKNFARAYLGATFSGIPETRRWGDTGESSKRIGEPALKSEFSEHPFGESDRSEPRRWHRIHPAVGPLPDQTRLAATHRKVVPRSEAGMRSTLNVVGGLPSSAMEGLNSSGCPSP